MTTVDYSDILPVINQNLQDFAHWKREKTGPPHFSAYQHHNIPGGGWDELDWVVSEYCRKGLRRTSPPASLSSVLSSGRSMCRLCSEPSIDLLSSSPFHAAMKNNQNNFFHDFMWNKMWNFCCSQPKQCVDRLEFGPINPPCLKIASSSCYQDIVRLFIICH